MNIVICIFTLLMINICSAKSFSIDSLTLLQNPPDLEPKIFGEDVISVQDRYEFGLSVSPGYDEIFFTGLAPA